MGRGRPTESRNRFFLWKQEKSIQLYKAGYSLRAIASILDVAPATISGFLIRKKIYKSTAFSQSIVCEDKHKVDSYLEKIIDDWLNHTGIEHIVHLSIGHDCGMKDKFRTPDMGARIYAT